MFILSVCFCGVLRSNLKAGVYLCRISRLFRLTLRDNAYRNILNTTYSHLYRCFFSFVLKAVRQRGRRTIPPSVPGHSIHPESITTERGLSGRLLWFVGLRKGGQGDGHRFVSISPGGGWRTSPVWWRNNYGWKQSWSTSGQNAADLVKLPRVPRACFVDVYGWIRLSVKLRTLLNTKMGLRIP